MRELTAEGRGIVEDAALRHGVSAETVAALLAALVAGHGGQAQFNVAELGGMGQWSRGGMTMVGDMFNHGLKARVDALCTDLSERLERDTVFAPQAPPSQGQRSGASRFGAGSAAWWPDGLGHAAATGAQNDLRYAVFPEARRLAIDEGGRVTVYDTGDHRIGGASQQQSGDRSLSFTSQHGLVRVADLPVVTETSADTARPPVAAEAPGPVSPAPQRTGGDDDVFGKIERLADLRRKGVLTEPEFEAKKAELLARL